MKMNESLKKTATSIRKSIIEMLAESGSGHPGGSLSTADILTVLYFHVMKTDPQNPKWEDRDRFVLSKGHGAPVLYATLVEKGFFPKEELLKLRKIDAMLQGHPDMKGTPGVEMSTGSLGQGFSASCGMAIANKLDKRDSRVYALLGDGELQEGLVWEAAMAAAHFKLDNLTAIIDYNGLQIDGPNEEVMGINPLADKFKAFNWNVIECDGHDFEELIKAFEEAKNTKNSPTVIIAKTVKGKGVSFMENQVGWHGNAPKKEEAEKALEELGGVL
ncbi:transketolase [Alkaliphilus peptidifermentans]|uniref:Transketolase n=1 Tax=Alkaliphilus peptidifermentans DSM 18978 TaxID=1120976 RepID=A0A1G5GBA9_9FIRM|nr:transketolase [Alkaliphilus peptidifermentans]SCY48812.1 transketolase [Alkaliphilus peptidifermentans DSM 18978]